MCGSIGTDIGIKYFSLVHAYRIILLLNIWIVILLEKERLFEMGVEWLERSMHILF